MDFAQSLRRVPYFLLAIICAASFFLMWRASSGDSAIMDELAHIPAGYGYVHNLDYRLNPEHPPLLKALAALPALFLNPVFPTGAQAWQTDVNGQWEMGAKFLYESGNDADSIVRVARIGPILLTILLIILIYIWSAQLLGKFWGLLPALLFGMSPTVLGHGHYVTTDLAAAFGFVFATFFLLKYLAKPSGKNLLLSGVAFGIAQALKFSAVLLVPFFVILACAKIYLEIRKIWRRPEVQSRAKLIFKDAAARVGGIIAVFFIGYFIIIYPLYFLFTVNYPIAKQTSDTVFILGSYGDGPTPIGQTCHLKRCPADLDIWMSKHALTRPFGQYLLGVLMVLQRSAGGNTNYFLGQVSASGSHFYFPTVYLLKEPLSTLIIVFAALLMALWAMWKKLRRGFASAKAEFINYLEFNFTEFSMILVVLIYWAWSIQSPLNIGFRHLLPSLPFIYMLSASGWKKWVDRKKFELPAGFMRKLGEFLKNSFRAWAKYALLGALSVWLIIETFSASPYFLSYFNELGGGVYGGYRYVTDSNYDWGQDLLRLKTWVDAHPEVDKIAVDYFGGGNIGYYFDGKAEGWSSSRGNPAHAGIHWLAVSINTLEGARGTLVKGQQRNPEDEYSWLAQLKPADVRMGNMAVVPAPDFRAGTSIFIYKL